ncbi:MAG: hypothetical protein AAGA57_12140 [Planctomycetota bacterium]
MNRFILVALVYAVFHFAVSFGAMWVAMDLESNWSSPLKSSEDIFVGIAVITSLPGGLALPLVEWLPRGPGVVSPWLYLIYAVNAVLWGAGIAFVLRACRRSSSRDTPEHLS